MVKMGVTLFDNSEMSSENLRVITFSKTVKSHTLR